MSREKNNRSCPECEQSLPLDSPAGLCPECLMLAGIASMPSDGDLASSGGPKQGEVFGGYLIGQELGRGGMGAVFEAEEIDTGRRVALKLLNHHLDSPEARARFFREGRLAASINHPNSVYVFGTEEIDELPAIAMELVSGGTLEQKIKTNGAMKPAEAVATILQIIDGLEAAAEVGILHRDVKPGNCFVDHDGTTKVGDFGLSISTEARGESHLTVDGEVLGTPAFASPEQLRGEELSFRSDIYAVGATLYYLLSGKPPFKGRTIAQIFANVLEQPAPTLTDEFPNIDRTLEKVVMKCLEKSSMERFGRYDQLREALISAQPKELELAPLVNRFSASIFDLVIIFLFHYLFYDLIDSLPCKLLIFIPTLLYFGLLEGCLGGTPGQRACRIWVRNGQGRNPGFWLSLLRTVGVIGIPPAVAVLVAMSFLDDDLIDYALGFAVGFVALAALFVTARHTRCNRSLIDRLTGTSVVRRNRESLRDGRQGSTMSTAGEFDARSPMIGPFHSLGLLSKQGDSEWLLAYDPKLLRKVWVRTSEPGSRPVDSSRRRINRPGRLRWLAGVRSESESWDAYEATGGNSWTELLQSGQCKWQDARHWVLDIAREMEAAKSDGTLPEAVTSARIWITQSGRAKLLEENPIGETDRECPGETPEQLLMTMIEEAQVALGPLPLRAGEICEAKIAAQGIELFEDLIKDQAHVSPMRRAALVGLSAAIPVFVSIYCSLEIGPYNTNWDVQAIVNLVDERRNKKVIEEVFESEADLERVIRIKLDKALRIHGGIANFGLKNTDTQNYLETIRDRSYPDVEEGRYEISDKVDRFYRRSAHWTARFEVTRSPWLWGRIFFLFAALPAMIAALLFGSGLLMRVAGLSLVNRAGQRLPRWATFIRSVIAWLPVNLLFLWFLIKFDGFKYRYPRIPFETQVVILNSPSTVPVAGVLIVAMFASVYIVTKRSIQDHIMGSYLVPR